MKKIIVSLITCFGFSFLGFAQKAATATPDTAFIKAPIFESDSVTPENQTDRSTEIISVNKSATTTKSNVKYEGDSARYKAKNKQPAERNYTPVKSSDY